MQTLNVLPIVLATLLQAAPQPAPRDARQLATGTGRITGVVLTDEVQARPLRRARVMISGDLITQSATATDEQGRFSFDSLPAGRFTLSAVKDGHVTLTYGAKRPGRPGTSIALAAGEHVGNITFKLPRGAVITGTVVDHNGDPAPNTGVRLMRYMFAGGQRRLTGAGAATTDERGIYRMFGLAADEYIVVATPQIPGLGQNVGMRLTSDADVSRALRELSSAPASSGSTQPARADQDEDLRTAMWAPVYFPSTVSVTDAGIVPVRAGEERSGIDIQLQLVPTGRIEGAILALDGASNIPPASVILVQAGEQPMDFGTGSMRVAKAEGGKFTFDSVPAGQYSIFARATPQRPRDAGTGGTPPESTLWASAAISVGGSGTSQVTLQLTEGLTVAGRVQLEPGSPDDAVPDVKTIRVGLMAAQTAGETNLTASPAQVDASGAFTISGVVPGRYFISAFVPGPLARVWLIKSALLGGRDVRDVPFDVRNESVSGVDVTMTNRLAQVSGAALDANGQPALDYFIIVFPANASLRTPQSRRVQAVRPSQDGKYVFRLPAGEYLLAGAFDVEQNEWQDPRFLERLVPNALRLTLADGEQKVQDLRFGGSEW